MLKIKFYKWRNDKEQFIVIRKECFTTTKQMNVHSGRQQYDLLNMYILCITWNKVRSRKHIWLYNELTQCRICSVFTLQSAACVPSRAVFVSISRLVSGEKTRSLTSLSPHRAGLRLLSVCHILFDFLSEGLIARITRLRWKEGWELKTGRINRRTVCLKSNNKHGKSLTRQGGHISACMSVCEFVMG